MSELTRLIFIFSPLLVQYILNDQRWIQVKGRGGCKPHFGKFSNLSGCPCLPLFHTQNTIISYNISSSPIDHYKKTVVIPLLDSLIIQMHDRFSDEDRHARHLLCLVQSIIVKKALQLDDEVEGMLFWEKDIQFLKSLSGNEVHRSKTLWRSTDRKLPLGVCNEDAFPTASVAFWSLPAPNRPQAEKLSDRFH